MAEAVNAQRIGGGPAPPLFAYVSIVLLGLLVASAMKTARDFAAECNHRELERVESPDRRLDAVFVCPIFGYFGRSSMLYVVPRGEAPPAWGPVLRLAAVHELPKLVWKNPQLLQIECRDRDIESFSSLWHSYDIEHGNYYVELRLQPREELTSTSGRPDPALDTGAAAILTKRATSPR
jgi:hypothetical protein